MPKNLSTIERAALAWLLLLVGVAVAAPRLPLRDPTAIDLSRITAHPTLGHLVGTDQLGRDVLSRIVFAARPTLLVVAGATSLALLLGIGLGVIAGYFGGLADRALRFFIDLFWSVPFVVFVVLVVSVVGVSIPTLILTISGINWVSSARVIRAETASLRQREFVRTARAYGFSEWAVAFHHVLPNLRSAALTLVGYGAVEILTLETGLAFIGLSLPAPRPTWGGLLADGASYFSSAWWLVASSAGVVIFTLASFQVLAQHFEKDVYVRTR